MKSRIIGLLAAFTIVSTASAGVLLWQVPETSISATDIYGGSQNISQSSGDYAWSYAMLQYTTDANPGVAPSIETASGNNTSLATYWRGNSLEGNGNHANASMSGRTLSSDLSTESNANYYIALYNSQNQLMGYSNYLQDISDFTAASHNIADWAGVNTATGGSWTAAPEPTSGVLLLLGAAVLGLRRRKVA